MSELPEYGAEDAFYILDLHCWVHRFFHTIGGRCAHGVVEFVGKILRDRDPAHFVVCRDLPFPTFRHDMMPAGTGKGTGYKETRTSMPDPILLERLRWTHEMLEDVYGVPVYGVRGFEADDLIGALATQAQEAGMRVVIVAHDKDLMQLVNSKCVMWDGKNNVTGPNEVIAKFGVRPDQLRDYLAIIGDGCDNVAGLHGAGPAAAKSLLGEWQTLEYALQHALSSYDHRFWKANPGYRKMLRAQKDDVLLAQRLVTLALDAPIKLNPKETRRSP